MVSADKRLLLLLISWSFPTGFIDVVFSSFGGSSGYGGRGGYGNNRGRGGGGNGENFRGRMNGNRNGFGGGKVVQPKFDPETAIPLEKNFYTEHPTVAARSAVSFFFILKAAV